MDTRPTWRTVGLLAALAVAMPALTNAQARQRYPDPGPDPGRAVSDSWYRDTVGNHHPERYPGWRYDRYALQRGYQDGYEEGLEAGRHNDRFDPYREKDYRKGDRGYDRRYGSRDAYKSDYREGFRAGYERGYRDGHYNGRREPRGGWRWPF